MTPRRPGGPRYRRSAFNPRRSVMMIKRNRRFVALGLVAALTLGAGCTSSESPVGPSAAAPAQAPELLLGGLGSRRYGQQGPVDHRSAHLQLAAVCHDDPHDRAGRWRGDRWPVLADDPGWRAQEQRSDQGRAGVGQGQLGALQSRRAQVRPPGYPHHGIPELRPWCSCPSASSIRASCSRCWTFFGRWTCLGSKAVTAPIDHFSRYAVAY